jgi:hypothetical protein
MFKLCCGAIRILHRNVQLFRLCQRTAFWIWCDVLHDVPAREVLFVRIVAVLRLRRRTVLWARCVLFM